MGVMVQLLHEESHEAEAAGVLLELVVVVGEEVEAPGGWGDWRGGHFRGGAGEHLMEGAGSG